MVRVLNRPFIFFSTDLSIFNDKRHTLLSTLNKIDSKISQSTDSYLTKTLLYGVLRLIQKRTRLFLTEPLTIFYPLKDLKNLFLEKNIDFHMQLFNPFRISLGLLIYLLLHFNVLFSICFFFLFCTPWHPRFSVPDDCSFLVYCCRIYRSSIVQIYKSCSLVSLSSLTYVDQLDKRLVITFSCRF